MRIALGIEYDGSMFHGWQKQLDLPTAQEKLEHALSRVADHPVETICAGRTDTGVHATGQVIHFESNAERTTQNWIFGANNYLAKTMSVRWAKIVNEDFHARFSAQRRRYRYIIYNHPIRPALMQRYVTWNYRPLDAERMNTAIQHLIGKHDFSSYRAMQCQAKSPVRHLYRASVERVGDFLIIDVTANGFLHHMVRNIAGVLMAIGTGKRPIDWSKDVLAMRNRTMGGITAPPYGLYLVKVAYPSEFEIPQETTGPYFISER